MKTDRTLESVSIAEMMDISDFLDKARVYARYSGWNDGYRKITAIMDEMTAEINRREENGLA